MKKTLRTMKKALLRVWRPFKKAFGVALVLTALVCGMIETPDMLEIWLRIIGALAFGAGLWLAEAYEWQQAKAIVDEGDEDLE